MYRSTKTFPPMSCAFRQWRAQSHCNLIHGYGLTFKFTFEAEDLDCYNWVVDFGNLKLLKDMLEQMFDHKTIVANDDPILDWYIRGEQLGTMNLSRVEKVGCEAFAQIGAQFADAFLTMNHYGDRVRLAKCEVWEHLANSASWSPR